jgi:hypothetical protein
MASPLESILQSISRGSRYVILPQIALDAQGLEALMAACASSSNVEWLHILSAGLDARAVELIGASLSSSVTELVLQGNTGVGAQGAKALASLLRVNSV